AAGILLNISRGVPEAPSALRVSPLAWLVALVTSSPENRWRGHRVVILADEVHRSEAPTQPGLLASAHAVDGTSAVPGGTGRGPTGPPRLSGEAGGRRE